MTQWNLAQKFSINLLIKSIIIRTNIRKSMNKKGNRFIIGYREIKKIYNRFTISVDQE